MKISELSLTNKGKENENGSTRRSNNQTPRD
jgi:hypothetical protein